MMYHEGPEEQEYLLSSPLERAKTHQAFFCRRAITVSLLIVSLGFLSSFQLRVYQENYGNLYLGDSRPSQVPQCDGKPCFTPSKVQVPRDIPTFPSYWNYAGPMNVTYDKRSIRINDKPVLLIGGSMHPTRATKATWEAALDEAVQNGLNLITIYVMWSAHQPFKDQSIDWAFEFQREWTLAEAISAAANRGLFVHIRVGPYDCAEYSYGGVPEWLPLQYPNILMRRPNRDWLVVMETFVTEIVKYLTENQLWAFQGGPIIMGQIENELGGEIEEWERPFLLRVAENGTFIDPEDVPNDASYRVANLQDYADWCGDVAQRLAPQVLWTMCNGLIAHNTIETYNGDDFGNSYLESYGDSGLVQVESPAMWTEDEGGFQIWGETAEHPADYFWGRDAHSMAYRALQWLARGGAHINYYMWWGGYNRGRSAGAGIMNAYATDAVLCPSGERRQPKFDHFTQLHLLIQNISNSLVQYPSQVNRGSAVEKMDSEGEWSLSQDIILFSYSDSSAQRDVSFLENNAATAAIVRHNAPLSKKLVVRTLSPYSAKVLVNGEEIFDSSVISDSAKSYRRRVEFIDVQKMSSAPYVFEADVEVVSIGKEPMEQTGLVTSLERYTDYVWYKTQFTVDSSLQDATLFVETDKANGIVLYVDGVAQGSVERHDHAEGKITMALKIASLDAGAHTIIFLSESLGYHNLIGRWGGSVRAKAKGLIGGVWIDCDGHRSSLIQGQSWTSAPGPTNPPSFDHGRTKRNNPEGPTWTFFHFERPNFGPAQQQVFLEIQSGRGHLWLNGVDLGRFWDIRRGNTTVHSQQYYHLPIDLMMDKNELVIFDVFGTNHTDTIRLAVSRIEVDSNSSMQDLVDFKDACLI